MTLPTRPIVEADEAVRRPAEIEDPTNLFFVHPIASRLTPLFAAMRISPNAVSVAGMSFGLLAAVAYYHYRDPYHALTGFVLMIAWQVLDGADGQLARLTHSQSQTGKVLDGICDYTTFIAVYVALTAALSHTLGYWVWGLAAGAGLCHIIQSAAYELQRQEYYFFGLGRRSAELLDPAELPRRGAAGPAPERILDALFRLYSRLQSWLARFTLEPRKRLSALLGCEPERAAVIRQRYRETIAPVVRRWSALSSNYRTLGIFIAARLAAPQYYFEFEIVGFSVILAALILDQRAAYVRLFGRIDGLR